ncbi:hypothetical protein BABINDRAFT_35305 [Babjeviella inositovora NRRL Y-12698]|uniref:Malate synthase n=1 Tax=Babjeviella inositovora NRRL Y-12698 TaxID=984486 RepID=A0A1E3QRD7_9ASCO|nr:uncharacterized protein BABINDRAFT_35305 [Babjeviella inositovora NRRL Y-12698]ODQ80276.1 hypothetical protein BABINDRAFT_35305 [Babjeviella inositovora NRRL Y-12698]
MPSPFPQSVDVLAGVVLKAPIAANAKHLYSPEALSFVATLHRTFNKQRLALLAARETEQQRRDAGHFPDFFPETAFIRDDATWTGPVLAPGLEDRRVEITGPTDRKMVINAFNSDVATYMADFEDSSTPTWFNVVDGQVNLYDAIRGTISLKTPKKTYLLADKRHPTLIVRPRGWHLHDNHITVDGEPVSGGILDFAIYFFNNAKYLVANGAGPYFYLPKMEHYKEAALWNAIFCQAQSAIGLPIGTIRATVLIETLPAAFQMDEIIYSLRQHSAGLNCGRWDYIFSFIKSLRNHKEFILPDRSQVTMKAPFMASYVQLLIETCHKRQVHAMGGMAALIPIKDDAKANEAAMNNVRSDKLREVLAGHDGTWVAHPALAVEAYNIFNKHMPGPNQIFKPVDASLPPKKKITARDLLSPSVGDAKSEVTEAGIRTNIAIGLGYTEAWLRGIGCVPINYLMEDAATAEVSRSQLWQWIRHGAKTTNGKVITADYVSQLVGEVVGGLIKDAKARNAPEAYNQAVSYFKKGAIPGRNGEYDNFLTLDLYEEISKKTAGGRGVAAFGASKL